MEKRGQLYAGKAKTVFETDHADKLILHFRDDTSAFDGGRTAALKNKGAVNNYFNAHIMEKLAAAGIATHFEKILGDNESLVKRLDMVGVECVVRNIAAGSICKRLGLEEGLTLDQPLYELFLKDDALHDPLINEDHAVLFKWAARHELQVMREMTLRVNRALQALFADAGILLVDFKLEFGRFHGDIILGDEFTPDGCRIWDAATRKKLDKDRFRRELGGVVEAYQEAALRLGIDIKV